MRSLSALSVVLVCAACAFGAATPLAITVSHHGNFLQGQSNASYLIRVSNPGTTKSTGLVHVTDQAQSGLKITSLSGAGWTCSNVLCWRQDALAAGQAYPAIVALATVDDNAPPQSNYSASVYRAGVRNGTSADVTAIDTYGYPIAWGRNDYGESSVPAGLTNGVAVAAGWDHSLALKSDGTVVGWGDDYAGATSVPAGLTNARAAYASVAGRIESAWRIENGRFQLDVTVPPNTTATIFVPAVAPEKVTEGGQPAARARGVAQLSAENGAAVFRVGSGQYRFESQLP